MFFCYFQVCGERKLTPTCQAMNPPDSSGDTGDSGSIPGLGRYPGVGNGNLLHYSCLENSMDRGAWWALVLGISKSWSQLSIHTQKWSEHLKRQSLCRRGTRDTLSTYLPHNDKYRSGRVGRAMGSDWPVFEPQLCHLLALWSRASHLTFLNSNSNVFINNTKAIKSRYYKSLF